MATTADFRNGLCIEFNGDIYSIVEFQHVKPGKGPAFVRTKLRNLKTGRVIPNTFTAGVKVNVQRIERRQYQFLYHDGDEYHFMHTDTFEQITIPGEIISAPQFLKEGQQVDVLFHADTETPMSADLPAYVDLLVTYTEPGERGNTATNALKEATVETGATVRVPLFVNEGEVIRIDSRTGDYSERVKIS